ncbi:hypothetical protein KKD70_03275 [Patescibacteria group bacterium]|nr:hypothetical protein [Patescibacteria group bacterium]
MKTVKNIQKISIVFFGITGSLHILAYLMILNEIFPEISMAMRDILQIPFVISAVIYAFVSFKLSISTKEEENKITNIIFAIFLLALMVGLIYLQLFVPDRI